MIYSPGGMPDGTQIQERDIRNIPSTRRNPILADIFARLGYMERQGSGLSKIRASYENAMNYQEGKDPVFRSNRVEFTVELPNLNFNSSNDPKNDPKNELKNGPKNDPKFDLADKEEIVLKLLSLEPNLTLVRLSEKVPFSQSTLKRVVKGLKERGALDHAGSRRSGHWIVKK